VTALTWKGEAPQPGARHPAFECLPREIRDTIDWWLETGPTLHLWIEPDGAVYFLTCDEFFEYPPASHGQIGLTRMLTEALYAKGGHPARWWFAVDHVGRTVASGVIHSCDYDGGFGL
jgi:hypothetical protein